MTSPAPLPAAPGAAREAHVVAQAKINLFLRILAREAGGHHQLETLFQRLELGDDVRVRVGVRGRALDCRGADVGPVERNLAWRAALAFAERVGWPDGFAIEIDKRIPVGGGLGGGSADAGAVLRCLNALAPEPLGASELLALAAPLGADVPFLTADAPLALAWGRGERMLALPPLPSRTVHLALFAEGVSTAEAFAALAEHRGRTGGAPRPILWTPERLARWDDVALVAVNDFEEVILPLRDDVAGVRRMFSEVGRMLDGLADERPAVGGDDAPAPTDPADDPPAADETAAALQEGDRVPIALMTGSGATVFLLTAEGGVGVGFDVRRPGADDDAPDGGSGEADDAAADAAADASDEDPPPLVIAATRTATRVAEVTVDG